MKRFFVILILLFLVPHLGSHMQDEEFFSGFVSPNILVILDSSMSMIWNMYGSWTNDTRCYGDGTKEGGTTLNGHYLENPFFGYDSADSTYDVGPGRYGTDSRLYICKQALMQVVNEFRGKIRWALATYKQAPIPGQSDGDFYRAYYGPGSGDYERPILQWRNDMSGDASEQCFIRSGLDFSSAQGPDNESKINNMLRFIDSRVLNVNENEEIRAVCYTPIPAALKGARYHLIETAGDDNAMWCRKYFVVLVTDGEPTQYIRNYPSDNWGIATEFGPPYPVSTRQSIWEAESLYTNTIVPGKNINFPDCTLEVKTYVLGIGNEGVSTMHAIADAGGTDSAYMATDPEDVVEALRTIFDAIVAQAYTFTAGEVTSIEEDFISTEYENRVFLASFYPSQIYPFWEGHLRAITLELGTLIIDSIPYYPERVLWNAGDLLRSRHGADRDIYGIRSDNTMLPFTNSYFSSADLAVANDADRDSVLNLVRYSRKDTVMGSNAYLGDIFHSSPLRIGSPTHWYRDDGFVQYRDYMSSRAPIIYCGSNTGLLHAFYDETGEEAFAVVPKNFVPEVQALKDSHRFYVDADPMAADVWFPTEDADTFKDSDEWKTVLMAAQGEGGRGITCLDVTSPGSPSYLFSFTDDTMGLTTSVPIIYKVGRIIGSDTVERFLAFFGGGECPDSLYNMYDPLNSVSLKGNIIVALDVEAAATDGPAYGSNYWFIQPDFADADKMIYPFVSAGTVVNLNPRYDNLYDLLYMPDLAGQMWKVDLTDPNISNWRARCIFQPPIPTSEAEDVLGGVPSQPAFFAPLIEKEPVTGCFWLFYGTGDRSKIFKDSTDNRFYAILDTIADSADYYPMTEGDLKRVGTQGSFDLSDYPNYRGWYVAFSDSGHTDEKVVSQAILLLDTLTVVTFDPDVGADPCNPGNGYAREYCWNFRTGGGRGRIVGSGIPQPPRYSFDQSGTGFVIHQTFDSLWIEQTSGYGTLKRILQWKER